MVRTIAGPMVSRPGSSTRFVRRDDGLHVLGGDDRGDDGLHVLDEIEGLLSLVCEGIH